MYTMREACEKLNMPYETLRFYCKEDLVPNIKRDKNNYRLFDERNLAWLRDLQCLRNCGMSLKDMRRYMEYCLQGPSTISQRQAMLAVTKQELLRQAREIEERLQYINYKQEFYEGVLSGKIKYRSNLIKCKGLENDFQK